MKLRPKSSLNQYQCHWMLKWHLGNNFRKLTVDSVNDSRYKKNWATKMKNKKNNESQRKLKARLRHLSKKFCGRPTIRFEKEVITTIIFKSFRNFMLLCESALSFSSPPPSHFLSVLLFFFSPSLLHLFSSSFFLWIYFYTIAYFWC